MLKKEPKQLISANSSAYGELEFNNLRANFFAEIPAKEFFNSHGLITTIALLRAYDTCLKYDARRSTVAERLDRVAEQPAL